MSGADSEMSTLPVLDESSTPVGELTLLSDVGVSGLDRGGGGGGGGWLLG